MPTKRELKTLVAVMAVAIAASEYYELPRAYFLMLALVLTTMLTLEQTRVGFYNFFSYVSPYKIEQGPDTDIKLLTFKNNESMEPLDLNTACHAILNGGIQSASINLAVESETIMYAIRFSTHEKLTDPWKAITDLVSDPRCKLVTLEICCSRIYSEDIPALQTLYNSMDSHSSLKNITITSILSTHSSTAEKIDAIFANNSKGIIINSLEKDKADYRYRANTYH